MMHFLTLDFLAQALSHLSTAEGLIQGHWGVLVT